MDLILTPKRQSDWVYSDIFSEKYLKEMILGIASKIAAQIQSEKEQGYFDRLKLKVLDNIVVKIEDVHVRLEEEPDAVKSLSQSNKGYGVTTFGLLLSSLDV